MCSTLLSFASTCRMPHGLPLVLYLPRVEAWAFSQVYLEADQAAGPSPGAAAVEKQMQQPAAAIPFGCQASLHNISAVMHAQSSIVLVSMRS